MIKTITLSDSEINLCRMLGNMRSLCNRGFDVKGEKRGKMLPWESDEFGAIGEYGFCKLENIFFDASVSPRKGGRDFTFMGRSFDMKTTNVASGRLLVMPDENMDVEYYALAILTGNTLTFPGFTHTSVIRDESRMTDLGYGKVYAMQQSELKQWKNNEESKDNSKGTG